MTRLLAVITLLGILWAFLALAKPIPIPVASGFCIVAFVLLIFFPEQTSLAIRVLAAAATIYVFVFHFGMGQTLIGIVGPFLVMFAALYIMFRPFLKRRAKR